MEEDFQALVWVCCKK